MTPVKTFEFQSSVFQDFQYSLDRFVEKKPFLTETDKKHLQKQIEFLVKEYKLRGGQGEGKAESTSESQKYELKISIMQVQIDEL